VRACAELWLAVEVDGAVHDARRVDDRERADPRASLGGRVVSGECAEISNSVFPGAEVFAGEDEEGLAVLLEQ